MISLWPQTPLAASGDTPRQIKNLVFPSGRQCITHALDIIGGQREWLTAIPEYSSHCLISAVAKKTTPLPISVASLNPSSIKCVILYRQWGWEKPTGSFEEIKSCFENAKLILDSVDTIVPFSDGSQLENTSIDVFHIFSLSKTIGTEGGGLIFDGNTWVANEYIHSNETEILTETLCNARQFIGELNQQMTKTWLLSDIPARSPALDAWLEGNSLNMALKRASNLRGINREVLLKYLDDFNWAPWMVQQVTDVSASVPAIIPLFTKSSSVAADLMTSIAEEVGVAVELYHFDRSPSYLQSEWEPCVAVPMHWQLDVKKIESIIRMWLPFAKSM